MWRRLPTNNYFPFNTDYFGVESAKVQHEEKEMKCVEKCLQLHVIVSSVKLRVAKHLYRDIAAHM